MKRIKSDKILLENELFSGYIYFEDGKIVDVTKEDFPVEEEYNMTGHYVSAGFIDIHTHGGGGYAFEKSVDEIVAGCNFHLKHGTTSICPTISADDFNKMAACVVNVEKAAKREDLQANIIGTHLEGPYLSAKQAGAQAPDFIKKPEKSEYEPLLENHSKSIARWSYAPENDDNKEFTKALKKYGVVASAGHTDAIYDDMVSAMEQGCNLVTHLYSCTSTITRDHGFRRLGVIETAYLLDDMYVEIICDGKHLPIELIKMIYKIKGADKIALITDSLSLAGTTQTHGFTDNIEYIIEDGVCKLVDRSAFAGSIATADRLVRVVSKEAGIPLVDAIKMLTKIPAKIMGLSKKGVLAAGMDADIVVFDEDICIKHVFVNGSKKF